MNPQQEQIREQQRDIWNKFSPGWKKWNAFNMHFLQPMGAAMIDYLQIKDSDHVLDIASGTGEPGLTIATLARNGKTISTDLSEDMLAIATATATERGIKNYETRVADACELPFADNSFDAISCRMGFMFFPDMELALQEMARVLKPGGRMAAAVWGESGKNSCITAIMNVVGKHIDMRPPTPGGPGMFRCSKPGLMTGLLTQTGFTQTAEKEIAGKVDYGTTDQYWEIMMEIAAPVVSAMTRSDEATRVKIKQELFDLLDEKNHSGRMELDYAATVFYGEKPA